MGLALIGVSAVTLQKALAVDLSKVPGRLETHLSRNELLRVDQDEKAYPNFMAYLKTAHELGSLHPVDKRNESMAKTLQYFEPNLELWNQFFKAAAADKLTCLRAFALLAREVKRNGVMVFGPGTPFEDAVKNNNVDLGLAIPAKNIAAALWSPDPSITDPEFLVHIKIYYKEAYVHRFPDEVLPANLKIAIGKSEKYWLENQEYSYPSISADLYYGPKKGIGFRNVKGVGGQKRGLLGFFQKVLFFLPDAVDSMTIREDKGEMITEALMNTTVKEFETNPIYSIRILSK